MALPRRPRFPLPPSRGTTSTRPRPLPSTPRPWLASGARQLLRAGKRVLPRSRRPSTLLLVALTSPLPTRRADLVLHACDPESPASVHAPRVLSRSAASCGRRCCNGPAAHAAPHSLEHEETTAARVYVHLGQQLYRPPLVERIGTRAPACGARRTKGGLHPSGTARPHRPPSPSPRRTSLSENGRLLRFPAGACAGRPSRQPKVRRGMRCCARCVQAAVPRAAARRVPAPAQLAHLASRPQGCRSARPCAHQPLASLSQRGSRVAGRRCAPVRRARAAVRGPARCGEAVG